MTRAADKTPQDVPVPSTTAESTLTPIDALFERIFGPSQNDLPETDVHTEKSA
jgi:hypothetical protein